MAHWKSLSTASVAALGVFAMANEASAQFVLDNAKIPNTGGRSENVDFADIDLDGDWDAAIGDGGDFSQQQNLIYLNMGGLQGGTKGVFTNATAARMPSILDQTRDIEFVDHDNDGDSDLYVSNTAQLIAQGNRWLDNMGGKQGGTLGFYTETTSTRFVGLGQPGSSIAASQVLPGNTFIDWSCDCDFGDMDNDGDLDLYHGSYGGAFGGQVPTRLFENDGDGHFTEFNPSGFQLPIATISPGNPGLWCEGNQATNTTNTSGAQCDIATSALDLDVGDADGDFDLDILMGDRETVTRMYFNRLDGSGTLPGSLGTPIHRDVTGGVYPPGYSTGDGHYEQEWGDLDFDGDLDIYGLNWQVGGFSFNDITLQNNGSGIFSNTTVLTGSGADDNEGDFIDYDNDGDLDLFVANFSSSDKLYRNNSNGTVGVFSYTKMSLPNNPQISLDADVADTDGDGDYDVLVSMDSNNDNKFFRNTTETPDTHAPYLPNIEDIGNQTAGTDGNPVRVHVYDNAPYYITWYNPTVMNVAVDGVQLPDFDAMSSHGQIFRGVLPGNLVGSIDYGFTSQDEYGNTGSSSTTNITGSFGGSFQSTYGSGTSGLTGGEPTITSLSVPFPDTTAYVATSSGAAPGTQVITAFATASIPATPIGGIATLNIGGTYLAIVPGSLDANGDFVVPAAVVGSISPGTNFFVQSIVADATGGGDLFASSKGLQLTVQ